MSCTESCRSWEGDIHDMDADIEFADDGDRREGRKESESSRESGQSTPKQLAPKKKAKRVKEKTLREELGMDRKKNYKQSSKYTGRGASIPQVIPPEDLTFMRHLFYLIRINTEEPPTIKRQQELRTRIHMSEVEAKYNNELLITHSKVLDPDTGLPKLVDPRRNAQLPWDIVADARALLARWENKKFDSSILRGILIDKKAKGISYKSDPEYKYQRVPADVVGHNGLVNGQWWPIRQGTLRDGAHGEVEAGISGKAGKGVFSIVMSNGGYADKDEGDVSSLLILSMLLLRFQVCTSNVLSLLQTIYYCGTESDTSTPTNGTGLLRSTLSRYRHPIRVLRAPHKRSLYAPVEGIRYDGLYDIVDEELLNRDTAFYRFKLVRVEGQDPIRHGGPERRPTREEVMEKERVWRTFANN